MFPPITLLFPALTYMLCKFGACKSMLEILGLECDSIYIQCVCVCVGIPNINHDRQLFQIL